MAIEDDKFGFEIESSGQICEFEVRRTVVPNLANFKVPTQSWNGVAKIAITFEPADVETNIFDTESETETLPMSGGDSRSRPRYTPFFFISN